MSWIDDKSPEESLDILGQLSEQCSLLGGPLSKALYELVKRKDYLSLVEYNIDYTDVVDVNDLVYARQILGLYQKLDFLDLGFDKADVAADRYVKAERMCFETNARFDVLLRNPQMWDSDVALVFHHAARKIDSILGAPPDLEALNFRFGPGANTNVKSTLACPRAKLGVPFECSINFAPTVGEFLSETPLWTSHHAISESDDSWIVEVNVVLGKVIFVPKNAKTHRSISVEPLLNSFFQLGVGSYIKERLLRSGLNLYDQTINQKMASLGSIRGNTATIDLVMASDCLSSRVVLDLLSFDWFDLLDQLRTPNINLPKEINSDLIEKYSMSNVMKPGLPYTTEKFAGMGNGYTFELESTIFYGLCLGVTEVLGLDSSLVSVYGDDLIVPVEAVSLLNRVLKVAGFSVNHEKSFASGPFRESCGADYLHGFDIRPFYQKTRVSERTLFVMHNWFVRHCEFHLAACVSRLCNPCYVLHGPDGFGDGHLIGAYKLRYNRRLKRDGWDGGYFDTYILKPRFFKKPLPGDAILPVYSVYTRSGAESPTDPNVIRGSSGYAKMSVYTLVNSIFTKS